MVEINVQQNVHDQWCLIRKIKTKQVIYMIIFMQLTRTNKKKPFPQEATGQGIFNMYWVESRSV